MLTTSKVPILNFENIAARIFSEEERGGSSTWREIANIHFSLFRLYDFSLQVKSLFKGRFKIVKLLDNLN